MSTLNKVILIGNLGADPEMRHTQAGKPVANFTLATSEHWKDRNTGERKERTEWHRIVIFNEGLAGIAERYLHKGSKIYLEGQLQTRKWTDKQGVEKYTTEIVLQGFKCALTMLDTRSNAPPPASDPGDYGETSGNESGMSSGGMSSADYRRAKSGETPMPEGNGPDDEIPF